MDRFKNSSSSSADGVALPPAKAKAKPKLKLKTTGAGSTPPLTTPHYNVSADDFSVAADAVSDGGHDGDCGGGAMSRFARRGGGLPPPKAQLKAAQEPNQSTTAARAAAGEPDTAKDVVANLCRQTAASNPHDPLSSRQTAAPHFSNRTGTNSALLWQTAASTIPKQSTRGMVTQGMRTQGSMHVAAVAARTSTETRPNADVVNRDQPQAADVAPTASLTPSAAAPTPSTPSFTSRSFSKPTILSFVVVGLFALALLNYAGDPDDLPLTLVPTGSVALLVFFLLPPYVFASSAVASDEDNSLQFATEARVLQLLRWHLLIFHRSTGSLTILVN
jgi:hypothetical protein